MKLRLDNGVTIEVEGDIEVSISQDGKTISLRPSQPVAPIIITTPVQPSSPWSPVIPNMYPPVSPWYPQTYPIITCGNDIVGGMTSNSYTVVADDPNLQLNYTHDQHTGSIQ